jgi:hypothetical protein
MKIKSRNILIASGMLFLICKISYAFCFEPQPRIKTEISRSELVLIGKVISKKECFGDGGALEGNIYKVRLDKIYKGKAFNAVNVFSPNDSSRALFELGQTYVMFLKKTHGKYMVGNCGNTKHVDDLKEADKAMGRVVEEMKKARMGDIRGRIVRKDNTNQGVPNIGFYIQTKNGIVRAKSDADGWFKMLVPPGTYKVKPESNNLKIESYDLSYDPPENVIVKSGWGAEVQFLLVD